MKLIKNGKVLTKDGMKKLDILIGDGIIRGIGENILCDASYEIIDVQNLYITPGGVDVHTHFDIDVGIRSCDDFYWGGRAAASGGTTTILDHPGFGPRGCSLHHQIDDYSEKASNCPVDYSFHGVVQELNKQTYAELKELKERGISSFKIYMTYDYKFDDRDILKFFTYAKELDIVTCVHAENHEIIHYLREKFAKEGKLTPEFHAFSRPGYCEAEAVNRLILLAETIGYEKLYLVHISSQESLQLIKKYREEGKKFYVETCPQYLYLTEEKYLESAGINYILSPPLRKAADREELLKNLNSFDTIGTDHCSFSLEDKRKGKQDFRRCPNGIPGVEERMSLLFTSYLEEKISASTFLETLCENPAKIFGLYPKKGVLEIGSDADIVFFKEKEHSFFSPASRTEYTCYSSLKTKVKVDLVMLRGKFIMRDETFIENSGTGIFLKRG